MCDRRGARSARQRKYRRISLPFLFTHLNLRRLVRLKKASKDRCRVGLDLFIILRHEKYTREDNRQQQHAQQQSRIRRAHGLRTRDAGAIVDMLLFASRYRSASKHRERRNLIAPRRGRLVFFFQTRGAPRWAGTGDGSPRTPRRNRKICEPVEIALITAKKCRNMYERI